MKTLAHTHTHTLPNKHIWTWFANNMGPHHLNILYLHSLCIFVLIKSTGFILRCLYLFQRKVCQLWYLWCVNEIVYVMRQWKKNTLNSFLPLFLWTIYTRIKTEFSKKKAQNGSSRFYIENSAIFYRRKTFMQIHDLRIKPHKALRICFILDWLIFWFMYH